MLLLLKMLVAANHYAIASWYWRRKTVDGVCRIDERNWSFDARALATLPRAARIERDGTVTVVH